MTKATRAPAPSKSAPAKSSAAAVRAPPASVQAAPTPAPHSVAARLVGGSPLPPTLRGRMENAFGRPFGDVRVHTDGAAENLTHAHHAEALTIGQHIAFGAGRFQPDGPSGQHLVAHELAHVAQQGAPGGHATVPQVRNIDSMPGEPAEVAAESAADQAVRGERVQLSGGDSSIRHRIMRRARVAPPPPPRNPAPLSGPLNAPVRQPTSPFDAAEAPATAAPVTGARLAPIRAMHAPAPPLAAGQREMQSQEQAEQARAAVKEAAEEQAAPEQAATTPAGATGGAAAATAATNTAAAVQAAPDVADQQDEAEAKAESDRAGAEAQSEEATSEEGDGGATAKKRAPASPDEDPAFQRVLRRVRSVARQQGHNNAAQRKAAEAQAAAPGPANEVESQAAGQQVAKMGEQETPLFDRQAFKAALMAEIVRIAPQSVEDIEAFKSSGRSAELKGSLAGQMEASKEGSQGTLKTTAEEEPSTAGVEPKPVTPQPPTAPGPPPPAIGAAGAAPKPMPEDEVSLNSSVDEVETKWQENNLTEERLQKAGEPAFEEAIAAKNQVAENAERAPAAYREQEAGILDAAKEDATGVAAEGSGGMYAARAERFGQIATGQEGLGSADTQKRSDFSAKLQQIYDDTAQKVKDRLDQMDTDANQTFDDNADAARVNFDNNVEAKKDAWRDEHPILAVGEALGFPVDLQRLYKEAQDEYVQEMDGVIDAVATVVETGLNDAKTIIDTGRQQVATEVEALPANLRQEGEQAAARFQAEFDGLESQVKQRQDQLISGLAQKYVARLDEVKKAIDAMKAEDRGWVGRAVNSAAGVIAVYEQIKALLARFADIVQPHSGRSRAFLSNLITGIQAGLSQFIGNILAHLQKGIMDWLFGAIAAAGIEIPKSFDLESIVKLVLQVLGLTYANFRARAVRLVGEPIVAAMETVVEIFQVVLSEGMGGLWRWIKDKVGDLGSMILDGILNWVKQEIVIAGITWILGLLNPAGGLIKIANAIIKIVDFFLTRGSQIMALANAVVNALGAIVGGATSVMAGAIENALAQAIPVTLGFLAALAGIGGISDMIREQIERVQAPVNKAIDLGDWIGD